MTARNGVAWPLCGRDEEADLIGSVVGPPDSGGTVVVLGSAGVGKTRLLRELSSRLEEEGRTVRWVVGGPLAQQMPLGAVAEYLPPETVGAEQATLVGHARRALAAAGSVGNSVVFVDDAQELDEQSATVVHQLCLSRSVAVVCAARSRVPAPMVTAVCRDDRTLVLELQPLGLADVATVLDRVLGGEVAERTRQAFYERSAGSALFLRELIEDALRTGALAPGPDGWTISPGWAPSHRLVELVHARLSRNDADEEFALDVVATGEPVGLGLLLGVASEEAVVRLERERLLEVRRDGRRTFVTFAHPLYRDAIDAQLGPLAARTHRLRLAGEIERQGARRRGDLLAIATGRLDGGGLSADDWLVAAQRALALRHNATTALAQRAVEAHGGTMAWVVLGEARTMERDLDGALASFAAGRRNACTDDEIAAVVRGRAQASFWLGHEVESVLTDLVAAEEAVVEPASRAGIAVQRVSVLINSGHTQEGVELAQSLLGSGLLTGTDRRRVQSIAANGLSFLGMTRQGRALGDALIGEGLQGDAESPFVMAVGAANVITADLLGGELAAA